MRALKEAGANLVAPELLETGLQLASFVLHRLGVDVAEIEAITGQERELRPSCTKSEQPCGFDMA